MRRRQASYLDCRHSDIDDYGCVDINKHSASMWSHHAWDAWRSVPQKTFNLGGAKNARTHWRFLLSVPVLCPRFQAGFRAFL